MDKGNVYALLGNIPGIARRLEDAARGEGEGCGPQSDEAWGELISTVKAAIKAVDDLREFRNANR